MPAGFEECTTESWEGDALVRRSLRLLPETGCAVDNLAAEISRATLPAAAHLAVEARACAVDALAEPGIWRCETVFGGLGGPRPRDRRGALESSAERTRAAISLDSADCAGEDCCDAKRGTSPCTPPRDFTGGGVACDRTFCALALEYLSSG